MKVIVTGSGGFVGKRFMEYNAGKYSLKPISLRSFDDAQIELHDVDVVVHLAGKAHDMKSTDDRPYFEINYELTRKLADQAKRQGVPHFVYISSVKVYGDDRAYIDEESPCRPSDAYGKSKLQAEQYLQSIQSSTFKIAIVRPPLVYGPGVKGNLIKFLRLAERDVPLPFGGVDNQRSMVYLDNLVELINAIIEKQATGIFVAGDLQPVSTAELMTLMREFMGKKPGLVSITSVGRKLLKALRPSLFSRLFGSFVINNQKTNQRLGFRPPYATEYGVKQMVEWYLESQKHGKLTAVTK